MKSDRPYGGGCGPVHQAGSAGLGFVRVSTWARAIQTAALQRLSTGFLQWAPPVLMIAVPPHDLDKSLIK